MRFLRIRQIFAREKFTGGVLKKVTALIFWNLHNRAASGANRWQNGATRRKSTPPPDGTPARIIRII